MKITLVNTPYVNLYGPIKISAGRYFPLGLGYIIAVLKKNNYDVDFLDPEVQELGLENLIEKFKKERPQIVGISCVTPNFSQAIKIASLAKEHSSSLVVLGGVHASAVPEWILKNSLDIDIIVIGEGESTFLEICDNIKNNKDYRNIKGIAYKENNKVIINPCREYIEDLDTLPFPAREIIDLSLYKPHPYVNRAKKSATIITSRGCPNYCIFCASHVTLGRKFRYHSAEYVLEEIKYLYNHFGVNHLVFNDDTFTIDRNRTEMICEGIIKNKIKIDWYCFMRVNNVDSNLIKLMKKAGCSSIGFGVETGDEEVLKKLRKGITIEQCRKAFKICNSEGIKILAFFVFGCPGDNKETINKTIKFAKELKPTLAFFNMLTPYPGTEVFEKYYKDSIIAFNDMDNFVAIGPKAAVATTNFSKEELQKYLFKAYIIFYLRLSQLWRIIKRIESFGELKIHIKAFIGLMLQMISWKKKTKK